MKTLFRVALVLTVLGAVSMVISGMTGSDLINKLLGVETRTTGSDFLRILIGLSAILTLIYGFKLGNESDK